MYVIRLMPKEKDERNNREREREREREGDRLCIERWSRRLVTLGV